MGTKNDMTITNQYGEKSINSVESISEDFAEKIPAKQAIADLTLITTPDGSDPATTQALVNDCKAKINALITALKGE